jgi:16S rRNA (adenine1518-N6/adenine1519-N6)-dimethyltransferase
MNIGELVRQSGPPIVVMGNLPYNISSQVLLRLIQARADIQRAILMFQKELVDRLMAMVGSKEYGRITVMLRYCADIRSLARISAHMFFPKPRVNSEVVEIRFKPVIENPADDETMLVKTIKASFGQRRKTLKNALSAGIPSLSLPEAARFLLQADIDPVRRAETLSIAEFVRLSNLLFRKGVR